MENYSSKVNYFCVGLGIGAAAAMLFAPKSGAETRDVIVRKAEEGKEYAQSKVRELRARAEDIVESGKQAAESGMQATAHLKESISGAVAAGRAAYQNEMSKAV